MTSEQSICPHCGKPVTAGALMGMCAQCLMEAGFGTLTGEQGAEPASFTPPSPQELASRYPQLEILELLGCGGMGAVYKVRQKQLDRFAALKILRPRTGDAPAFADRFAREAQTLAKLHHPNIVTLYEFGEAGGQYYFLMEYVDGLNLRKLLDSSRVSPKEALAIVPQICDALQFAHDRGVVHRDIKPENILVNKAGDVKIADFGVAKLIAGSQLTDGGQTSSPAAPQFTEAGKVIGTPQYMAPEQFTQPQEVDNRADIYALGVVFYQMLTGELPGRQLMAPSSKVQIDVRLDEVVLRALEANPDLRYSQANALKTQVETIATTWNANAGTGMGQAKGGIPAATASASPSPPEEARFSITAIVGAFWAAFVVPAFIGMFWASETHASPPPDWPQLAVMFLLLAPGLTAPIGTTILGCIAISRICRSQGRLRGLGLATFDALFFPILLLDLAIFSGGVAWIWRGKFVPSGPGFMTPFHPARAVDLMVLLSVLILLLDFWIIRKVRRKVGLSGAARRDPGDGASRSRRRKFRVAFASVAAMAALLSGSLWFWSQAHPPVSAEIRCEVFELDAATVDQLIPKQERQTGLMPDTWRSMGNMHTVGSFDHEDAERAEISTATLDSLLDHVANPPNIHEHKRNISYWPIVADTWSQSLTPTGMEALSTGSGYLGVRRKSGELQVRMEYLLTYSTEPGPAPTVMSEILYEGAAPDNGALAFLVPFARGNSGHRYLVVTFDVSPAGHTETLARFRQIMPYPAAHLTLAWDGSEVTYPDLMAFLPVVRHLPDYEYWLKRRDIHRFTLTNDADYRFEALYGGRVQTSSGELEDLVMELLLFRPDGTLLARMTPGPPDPDKWETTICDATGKETTARVYWSKSGPGRRPNIDKVVLHPNKADQRTWLANPHRVVSTDGTEHRSLEQRDAPAPAGDIGQDTE